MGRATGDVVNIVEKSIVVPTIGKMQRLPLREVWQHEAHDFTTWLQENLDELLLVVSQR
jgi:hypothetical protein